MQYCRDGNLIAGDQYMGKKYKRIWLIFMLIIMLTSVVSGIIWNYNGHRGYGATNAIVDIEKIKISIQSTKEDIKEIKCVKMDFENNMTMQHQYGENENVIATNYYDEDGQMFITDYYDNNGNVLKTYYDINKNGKPDVIEYDTDTDGIIDTIEYYLNGHGKPDAIEHDTNGDGIIDTTEIDINIDGNFIPISSFGNIIM